MTQDEARRAPFMHRRDAMTATADHGQVRVCGMAPPDSRAPVASYGMPGYWMHESSGVLRPAVLAYLNHEAMTPEHIASLRAYLRQWIAGPWQGDNLDLLRATVGSLNSRKDIASWLEVAERMAIDPL